MMMSERSNHEKRSVARVVGSREILPSQFNPVDPFFFRNPLFSLGFLFQRSGFRCGKAEGEQELTTIPIGKGRS